MGDTKIEKRASGFLDIHAALIESLWRSVKVSYRAGKG